MRGPVFAVRVNRSRTSGEFRQDGRHLPVNICLKMKNEVDVTGWRQPRITISIASMGTP